MLAALLDWAEATPGIEAVRLRVHACNTRAVAVYERAGFMIEGREWRGLKRLDGTYDDVLFMVRHLKGAKP